jgi:PAS domain S-box-containing protein
MTETTPQPRRAGGPTWLDWTLPAAASVGAVILGAGVFTWWGLRQDLVGERLGERARLEAVGRSVAALAAREGGAPGELDGALARLAESAGVETIERLETGITPSGRGPGVVSVVVPLPDNGGSVHLVHPLRGGLDPGVWALPLGVTLVSVLGVSGAVFVATRRTSGLRRVGSALRALEEGESDRDVLRIAERFGADAVAWNHLLERSTGEEGTTNLDAGDRRDTASQSGVLPSSALDAMPVGMMALDERGRLLFCNGAAGAMLGISRASAIGQAIAENDRLGELVPVVERIASGSAPRATVELTRGEGARRDVIRATVRALRKEDDATIMVILEDITQQRVADEARNGFVAQATHELRAPLTNIRLLVEEAIETGAAEPSLVARSLTIVNQEARRLERVVADMLSVSEIEAATLTLNLNDVPLARMFADLEADYEAQAREKSIEMVFALPAKLEGMRGDREKLALLLHNVLGNAIKYTPEGGSVRLVAERDAGALTVTVTDTGPGIAPDEHEKVFQKFYRTEQARTSNAKGSGLGLALAREIARLHGGDITLESAPGHGSTFIVRIPDGAGGAVRHAA